MAFERRKVTEKDQEFIDKFEFGHPYSCGRPTPDEWVADDERGFYLFYMKGIGYKKMGLPMFFGFIYNNQSGMTSAYRNADSYFKGTVTVQWEMENASYPINKTIYYSQGEENQKIYDMIREAIVATKNCFRDIDGDQIENRFETID